MAAWQTATSHAIGGEGSRTSALRLQHSLPPSDDQGLAQSAHQLKVPTMWGRPVRHVRVCSCADGSWADGRAAIELAHQQPDSSSGAHTLGHDGCCHTATLAGCMALPPTCMRASPTSASLAVPVPVSSTCRHG